MWVTLRAPRSKAAWACAAVASVCPIETVMPRLVKWLRDPSDAEAQFGAEAAGRIGPDARQALPALRERYAVVDRKLAGMEESERASSDAAVLRKALVDAISSVSGGGGA